MSYLQLTEFEVIGEFDVAESEKVPSMFAAKFTRILSACRARGVEHGLRKHRDTLRGIGGLHGRDLLLLDHFVVPLRTRTT